MMDLESIRNGLVRERERLVAQLDEMGIDAGGGSKDVGADEGFADSGAVTAEKGELISVGGELHTKLDEVEAALRKLEAGTFGSCEKCGSPIDEARLEMLPSARRCKSCAT